MNNFVVAYTKCLLETIPCYTKLTRKQLHVKLLLYSKNLRLQT